MEDNISLLPQDRLTLALLPLGQTTIFFSLPLGQIFLPFTPGTDNDILAFTPGTDNDILSYTHGIGQTTKNCVTPRTDNQKTL